MREGNAPGVVDLRRGKKSWNWVKRVGINAGFGDLRREKSWNWVQKGGNDSGIRDLRRGKSFLERLEFGECLRDQGFEEGEVPLCSWNWGQGRVGMPRGSGI